MNYYILTGAGFSKNFGGWVSSELWAFLIGHHTIQNNEKLKELLWNNKNNGFENALHEVKKNAENNEEWKETYIVLQNVISEAFEEMNESYQSVTPGQGVYYIERFLEHFNVIFTTNQDTLVENKFLNLKIGVPGMSSNTHLCGGDISKTIYYPTEHCDIPQHLIPYIKLHGSSNWRTEQGGEELMILGNEKDSQIQDNPLMKKYFELFRESLSRPNSRLLILGHSLADLHINKIIFDKIKNNGLKFYIWNHSGLDSLMKKLIDTPGYDVELFKKGFIGISNAPLQELLRRDVPNAFTVEFKRIQREFF